mgnify:FL=1
MIAAVVNSACKAIFANRFYPTTFAQKDGGLPRWPAGRYTIIDAVASPTVCGTDDESTDDVRVQIDVVAETLASCMSLTADVVAALQDTDPPCVRDSGPRYTFDEETRTHRSVTDFVFYQSSESTS